MFNVSMFALRARAFRALHLSFSLRRSIFKRLTVGMLTTWALLGIQGLAQAQFRVEVSGVGITQIPINLNQFKDESVSPQKISQIIQADLERSAKFKVSGNSFAMDESSRPDFNALRQKALENFVTGSVTKLADGRFDVRFRLWDLIKAQDLGEPATLWWRPISGAQRIKYRTSFMKSSRVRRVFFPLELPM